MTVFERSAGCGPTILYWSLFVPAVTEILGFDGDCGNIVAARRTVQEAKDGQFRTAFVEAAEHARSCHGCGESVVALLKSRAQAVGKLRVGDLARPWPYRNGAFDHVISCFALECLRDWIEFDFALSEAFRVLRSNSAFVLVNVAETTNWNCGGIAVPILCVRESDLRQRLEGAGFANAATRQGAALDLSLRDQGYTHVLFSRGVKPSVD